MSSRGHQVWVGAGLAEVMRQYEWARVGVINEDTTWGSGSADAFIEVVNKCDWHVMKSSDCMHATA